MFYRLVRTIVSMALGLFYRVEVVRRVDDFSGPVMFVGNHPNSLLDPAMVFMITDRQVTFLAREPLFRAPVLGWILRGVGALPVYRKQDHPGLMEKNEGTLDAAANALITQKAITIFPEGKSHSAPQLSDIKTGCARIALKAVRGGQALRIIPIGLTYAQKHLFRSKVHVEVGEPILVQAVGDGLSGEAEQEWVRSLTHKVGEAMRTVTLNLESWEDLDLIHTADRLFALRNGYREKDTDRLRLFARGASMLRTVDPERFDDLKEDVLSFHARLEVVSASPGDLAVSFEEKPVRTFVLRNLAAITFGFPLFAVGMVLYFVPYLFLKALALAVPVSRDRVGTLKFISAVIMVPLWWSLLTVSAWWFFGLLGMVIVLLGAFPLAVFTLYFVERRRAAFNDVVAFFKLGDRSRLRAHLLAEGERLQEEIQRIAEELKPKLEAELRQPG
ncbi:MAG: 1-acyl-sn-glycerol-3-phosphate acyltransferase [Archangium sp.]|nr:1-acyl-sn-glycerol-3-phosphate acyltransferase [Archangium sp.]MDP3156169.1 1-acyl-sn-glycerol-3-phosphate acyltransferase [Archangium sp.]MDP3571506.1 1-acyl-sn-glycerol-3-phosphate acyltransferase [Archangium sp.]